MSERIKSNQINRLAREEKEMLTQQVATLSTQVSSSHSAAATVKSSVKDS